MTVMLDRPQPEEFGANSWLVEEMYEPVSYTHLTLPTID
jgi:hypothetical protein